jgi:tRNA(Arg) A34 adenosine deaminase TadA
MNNDEFFLKRAIELAQENVKKGQGGPFGAVIVKDGKIIAEGTNLVTSSNDPTAHAEIVAIRNACKELGTFQLSDCEIYSSCEPCPMCLGAIYWARPKRLIFAATRQEAAQAGFDDEFIYQEVSKSIEQRQLPTQQLPIEERMKPFEEWNNTNNKIPY